MKKILTLGFSVICLGAGMGWGQTTPAPATSVAPAAPAVSAKEISAMEAKLWGFDYGWMGKAAGYGRVLSGKTVCESGDQRTDDAADGGAVSAGCDQSKACSSGDSGGNE